MVEKKTNILLKCRMFSRTSLFSTCVLKYLIMIGQFQHSGIHTACIHEVQEKWHCAPFVLISHIIKLMLINLFLDSYYVQPDCHFTCFFLITIDFTLSGIQYNLQYSAKLPIMRSLLYHVNIAVDLIYRQL